MTDVRGVDLTASLRNMFTGTTRRRADPTLTATLSRAHAAFGTWSGVAAALGLSARTLRRVRAGSVSPASRDRIRALGLDPAVRAVSVTPTAARRLARMQARPTRVTIKADQGPTGYGQGNYKRVRTITFDIPPSLMSDMIDAHFNGDDREAAQLFSDAVFDEYGDGRMVGDSWEMDNIQTFNIQV